MPSDPRAATDADAHQLASGAAHEIWSPLTVIKTMMYVMRGETDLEHAWCTDFTVVDREITRIEASIQQLLDFAWPADPELVPVRLGPIVERAVDRLGCGTDGPRVRIATRLEPDVVILADAGLIERVVVNLGLNALHAMPSGGMLTIEAGTEGPFAHLQWEAVPATAPAEPLPADASDGLRLAIAQQIVARHGGRMETPDTPAGGTRLTVVLPRTHAVACPNQTAPRSEPRQG